MGVPEQTSISVFGLVTGRDYKFSVAVQNFNGLGTWYDPAEVFFACLPPQVLPAPWRNTTSVSSILVEWRSPENNGGCEVTGYAIFCDDGAGGAFSEVNEDNDALVRDIPGLYEL